MHMESLDARRLMVATGLDPTFGSGGLAKLPAPTYDDGAILVAAGSGFFAKVGDDQIVRYTAKGRIDTTWGDNGVVDTPFVRITQMAYDTRFGMLYASGRPEPEDSSVTPAAIPAAVTRFTRNGDVDASFGTSGVVTFTPDTVANTQTAIVITHLAPFGVGRLMVGLDRTATRTDVYARAPVSGDIAIANLKLNGVRDVTYGNRGVVNLLGNRYVLTRPGEGGEYKDGDVSTLLTVQPQNDGSTKTLFSRQSGDVKPERGDYTYYADLVSPSYDLKARTISDKGVVDPAKAYSWNMNKGGGAGDPSFDDRFATYEANGSVTVIGTSYLVSNYNTNRINLTPGRRGTTTLYPPLAPRSEIVRNTAGYYFAIDVRDDFNNNRVVRLTPDLEVDETFGVDGIAGTDATNPLSAALPDPNGGVLTYVATQRVARFV